MHFQAIYPLLYLEECMPEQTSFAERTQMYLLIFAVNYDRNLSLQSWTKKYSFCCRMVQANRENGERTVEYFAEYAKRMVTESL